MAEFPPKVLKKIESIYNITEYLQKTSRELLIFVKDELWEMNRINYNTPEDNAYKKNVLIKSYKSHIYPLKESFHHRFEDLLVLNVAEDTTYQRLCDFLWAENPFSRQEFPWKNKT